MSKTKTPRASAAYSCQPKARVMWSDPGLILFYNEPNKNLPADMEFLSVPVAVIPAPTAAKSRQIVKAAPFLTMTEGEQVDVIAAASSAYAETTMGDDQAWNDRLHSLAILAAITGGRTDCRATWAIDRPPAPP